MPACEHERRCGPHGGDGLIGHFLHGAAGDARTGVVEDHGMGKRRQLEPLDRCPDHHGERDRGLFNGLPHLGRAARLHVGAHHEEAGWGLRAVELLEQGQAREAVLALVVPKLDQHDAVLDRIRGEGLARHSLPDRHVGHRERERQRGGRPCSRGSGGGLRTGRRGDSKER